MVSRRNFFSIVIIMFVVLFMFQLSGVVKETWNDYGINQYAEETKSALTSVSAFTQETAEANKDNEYVILISGADIPLTKVVKQWCVYSKREILRYDSLKDVVWKDEKLPISVLLDSSSINWDNDITLLQGMVQEGVNLIFCNLPPVEVIATNQALKELLGIVYIADNSIELTGIKLYSGFLLGGEEVYIADDPGEEEYQDLDLTIPWYTISSGTKNYMVGLLDKKEYKDISNEYLPTIIWRNSIGKARVFAVNGDYLSSNTGIGILEAMMAEMKEYEIYPVVNAQSIIYMNYPVLSEENYIEINNRYSRTSHDVFMNILWPSIVSLSTKVNAKISCMMNLELNYEDGSDPDSERLKYYFKLISERKGEVGLSGTQKSKWPLKDKFNKDYTTLHSDLPSYQFTSFYADQLQTEEIINQSTAPVLKDLRTVLMDYEDNASLAFYINDNILALRSTIDGYGHTYSEDLRVKSLETALGYSLITADMEKVLYPEDESDGWESLYNDLSRFTSTYWRNFTTFEQTTLSEADKRMREFLAMDYSVSRSDHIITLNIKHYSGEGWFILRTHNEKIAGIDGGTYKEIEDDAYLITANQDTLQITLSDNERAYYPK